MTPSQKRTALAVLDFVVLAVGIMALAVIEMNISKNGFYEVANTYTRAQLREIANAINTYLAK